MDKLVDWQTGRLADWQTGKLANCKGGGFNKSSRETGEVSSFRADARKL